MSDKFTLTHRNKRILFLIIQCNIFGVNFHHLQKYYQPWLKKKEKENKRYPFKGIKTKIYDQQLVQWKYQKKALSMKNTWNLIKRYNIVFLIFLWYAPFVYIWRGQKTAQLSALPLWAFSCIRDWPWPFKCKRRRDYLKVEEATCEYWNILLPNQQYLFQWQFYKDQIIAKNKKNIGKQLQQKLTLDLLKKQKKQLKMTLDLLKNMIDTSELIATMRQGITSWKV